MDKVKDKHAIKRLNTAKYLVSKYLKTLDDTTTLRGMLPTTLKKGSSKSVSNKEVITDAYKKILETRLGITEVDGDSIKDIIDFVLDADNKLQSEDIKQLDETIRINKDAYEKAETKHKNLNKYATVVEADIDRLQKEEANLKEKLASLKKDQTKASLNRAKDKAITNSNIGTFRKLHTTFETEEDNEVIEYVVNEFAKSFEGGIERLDNLIGTAGDRDIHNDVIDTIITTFNFIAQHNNAGSVIPDKFYTMDMETVDTPRGKTPYSITLVVANRVDGVLKYDVLTTRMNNEVFFREAGDPYLENFYRQQQEIELSKHRGKPGYNEDVIRAEANEKTDALIKSIKTVKNTIESTEVLMRLVDMDPNTLLVAHNGARFDFPNYDKMLQGVADRAIMNLYYSRLESANLHQVRKAWKESTLGKLSKVDSTDELIKLYTDNIDVIMERVNKGLLKSDSSEIQELKKFNNALWLAKATKVIDKVQADLGFVIDEDLKYNLVSGSDSQLSRAKILAGKWLTGTDVEKR